MYFLNKYILNFRIQNIFFQQIHFRLYNLQQIHFKLYNLEVLSKYENTYQIFESKMYLLK